MCGGEIFKTNALALVSAKWSGGVELQRNCQPSFCRPRIYLAVKSLVVLVSVLRLHGRLLGLLITRIYTQLKILIHADIQCINSAFFNIFIAGIQTFAF